MNNLLVVEIQGHGEGLLALLDYPQNGALSCARYLEPYAMVWIHMAIKGAFAPEKSAPAALHAFDAVGLRLQFLWGY